MRRRRRKLRTQQPRRRLAQHALVHQPLLVRLGPRAPAASQAQLLDAPRRHALKMRHALLPLFLEPQRGLPRFFEHSLILQLELLFQLGRSVIAALHLGTQLSQFVLQFRCHAFVLSL